MCFTDCSEAQSHKSKKNLRVYNVTELIELPTRNIEEKGEFVIIGKRGNSINLLGIKGFVLEDTRFSKYYLYVTTEKATIPGTKGDELLLHVRFYKEFRIGDEYFFFLKEVK
ncbi:MAG: hypothetical protein ACFFG0_05160 [Candidatus Thorarchaeota archaeon]